MYWKMHMIRTMYVGNRSHMKTAMQKAFHMTLFTVYQRILIHETYGLVPA